MYQRTVILTLILSVCTLSAASAAYQGGTFKNERMLASCKELQWFAALGYTFSGNYGDLEKLSKVVGSQQCRGFLGAAKQAALHNMLQTKLCLPEEASIAQLSSIYTIYISKHPELWHKDALPSLMHAWEQAFRCK